VVLLVYPVELRGVQQPVAQVEGYLFHHQKHEKLPNHGPSGRLGLEFEVDVQAVHTGGPTEHTSDHNHIETQISEGSAEQLLPFLAILLPQPFPALYPKQSTGSDLNCSKNGIL